MGEIDQPRTEGNISLKIKVDGQQIDCMQYLVSVTAYEAYGKIATAEIVFDDGGNDDENFAVGDSDTFLVGNEIEISAGYDEDVFVIFKGLIIKQAIRLKSDKSELVVTAKHQACRMSLVRNNVRFSDKTDSDILCEIIRNYNIDFAVEDTEILHETLVQYNATDWDFINMRAEANGKLLFTSPEGIVVQKPNLEADPKLKIDSSFSVFDLEAEMDGRKSFSTYTAKSWNYTSQEKEKESVRTGKFDTEQGDLSSSDIASKMGNEDFPILMESSQENSDAMKAWANTVMMRNNLSRIVGKITIPGYADIHPGDNITIDRVGQRFNGGNIVSTVVHDITGGDWHTIIHFGIENEGFAYRFDNIDAKPADGVVPAVNGLQVAKVEQLENDPIGENRIMIRLLNGDDTTLWARIALLDAGKERGTFFMPEIDDEVVVGFIDDNPNKAVVLGMLHSSVSPAPVEAGDQNHIKGIYSREKMKLEFDDENKSVTIATPNGNSLSISDKKKGILLQDQNGNKMTLDDNGIIIESAKSLTIKAQQDISIEGNNVNIKANMALKATGNSGAELSTNGTAVVKGSIVQIN